MIAQGGWEQPAVFRGNDLPGVMLASAAQRLLYRHAVLTSQRVAVLTANAEGYAAALDALRHGAEVAAVLDLRSSLSRRSRPAAEELARRGVSLQFGVEPVEASARSGSQLSRFDYTRLGGADGRSDGQRRVRNHLGVDGLWMSLGFAPANALLHQARAQLAWSEELGQFLPEQLPAGLYACGKVNGVFGLAERVVEQYDESVDGSSASIEFPQPARPGRIHR